MCSKSNLTADFEASKKKVEKGKDRVEGERNNRVYHSKMNEIPIFLRNGKKKTKKTKQKGKEEWKIERL